MKGGAAAAASACLPAARSCLRERRAGAGRRRRAAGGCAARNRGVDDLAAVSTWLTVDGNRKDKLKKSSNVSAMKKA